MKLALLGYLASIAKGLSMTFFLAGIIPLIGMMFLPLFWSEADFLKIRRVKYSWDDEDEIMEHNKKVPANRKFVKKCGIGVLVFSCFSLFISVLIPDEKTIYIMTGAYITEEIVTNPRVQKIGNDVLEVVESKLSEMKVGDSKTAEDKPIK